MLNERKKTQNQSAWDVLFCKLIQRKIPPKTYNIVEETTLETLNSQHSLTKAKKKHKKISQHSFVFFSVLLLFKNRVARIQCVYCLVFSLLDIFESIIIIISQLMVWRGAERSRFENRPPFLAVRVERVQQRTDADADVVETLYT